RWAAASISCQSACLLRGMSAAHEPEGIRSVPAHALPGRMGCLCEAALWRTPARPAVSGPLHPSRGDLESPPPCGGRRSGHLSLEGLRPSQQVPRHDSHAGRVPPPLLATCPAEGVPEDSLFRLDGRPSARSSIATLPNLAPCSASNGHSRRICSEIRPLAVSPLPRANACGRAAEREADLPAGTPAGLLS